MENCNQESNLPYDYYECWVKFDISFFSGVFQKRLTTDKKNIFFSMKYKKGVPLSECFDVKCWLFQDEKRLKWETNVWGFKNQ